MSAFAVVYRYSDAPEDRDTFDKVMERLAHRGSDGRSEYVSDQILLGHWHFWTTPEEVGEQQPLGLDGTPLKIVFDGRLDNRAEIALKLNLNSSDSSRISDAVLVLWAYSKWGDECFKQFSGEFAIAIYNEANKELTCARDHLGGRTLFYACQNDQWIVASEPWAVTAACKTRPPINESALACFFAVRVPEDGLTFFTDVYELLPAHIVKFKLGQKQVSKYWEPDPYRKTRYKSDEEYAAHFLSLLEGSVRSQLRSSAPVGVLMSGGLDSTSVACLSARMIAPRQLTTFSYVFDELPECDERTFINTVSDKYDMRSIQIPCDTRWPLRDLRDHAPDPNEPVENPYRQVHHLVFSRAREEGMRVLLHGGYGDHLYISGREWLTDLFFESSFGLAVRELYAWVRKNGIRRAVRARFAQRIVRRLVDAIPGGRNLVRRSKSPDWLSPHARGFLPVVQRPNPKIERHASLLGNLVANQASHYFFKSSRHEIELRSPYRNRELVEFVMSLPAYQLTHHGISKFILRNAMRGILPEPVISRTQPTSLLSFFYRGIDRESSVLQAYLQDPRSEWGRYVNADWLSMHWDKKFNPEQDGPEALVLLLCVSFELWRNHFSVN